MRKTHLRLLALCAASLVAVAALAGCASQQENTQGNGNDGDEVNNGTSNRTVTPGLDGSFNETGNSSMNQSATLP